MKSKIIILLVLVIIFSPLVSNAIIIPTANLTIVVNTQGNDMSFHFNLTGSPGFNLQTQNLTGLTSLQIFVPSESYNLSQDNAQGLKVNSIFCISDNPNDAFFYQMNSVLFTPKLYENITCTFNNVKSKTPVLIVPGVTGTELKKGNELLWADLNKMMITPGDNFMDPLAFSDNLMPSDLSVYISDVIKTGTLLGATVLITQMVL